VAFPLALLLIDFAREHKPKWLPITAMLALSAAAGARVLYATKLIAGSGSGFGQSTTPWKYFLTQGHALPGYLWRLLVPVQMSIDPARPPDSLEGAILAWVVLALALTIASWFWAKSPQPGFWLIPAWLLLLPSSSIFPAADAVAYRRLYLPLALLAIAFALIGAKYPKPALALILLWTAFAAARRSTWQSEVALWREAAELAPTQTRPLLQLARLTPRDEALRHLDKAKLLTPADPEVASERGRVWLESGDPAQALPGFGRAPPPAPTTPPPPPPTRPTAHPPPPRRGSRTGGGWGGIRESPRGPPRISPGPSRCPPPTPATSKTVARPCWDSAKPTPPEPTFCEPCNAIPA